MTKTYDAKVTRDGKWWMVELPALDGLTQARRVSEVEQMARELIAVTLDVPLSTVAVDLHFENVGTIALDQRLDTLHRTKEFAQLAARQVAADTRQLAIELVAAGVPLRDVGTFVDLSFQRVQQLVSSD